MVEINDYPWQQSLWQQLLKLKERLPSALLLHGAAGTGSEKLAERFAKALLCEQQTIDGHACGKCVSCHWFSQNNHPDYYLLTPESMQAELLEQADNQAESSALESQTEPANNSKRTAKASREIKIDQIRRLLDWIYLPAHRGGARVVLIYPAQAMNLFAANALLKILEEAPKQILFLLVADHAEELLPTILSRCQKWALGLPDQTQALRWLQDQGIENAELWLAEQGGSPILAFNAAQTNHFKDLQKIFAWLACPEKELLSTMVAALLEKSARYVVSLLQKWVYDLFCCYTTNSVRYYPQQLEMIQKCLADLRFGSLLEFLKYLQQCHALVDHPLSEKLFVEDLLLRYQTIFGSKIK